MEKTCKILIIILLLLTVLTACSTENEPVSSGSSNKRSDTLESNNSYLKSNYMSYQYLNASEYNIPLNDFSKEQNKLSMWVEDVACSKQAVFVANESWVFSAPKYKLTNSVSEYTYYGETKDNYADGYGVLKKTFSDGVASVDVLVYIGSFSKGQFDGYGIQFVEPDDWGITRLLLNQYTQDIQYLVNYVQYEGYFEKGERSGLGNQYDCDLYFYLLICEAIGKEDDDISLNEAMYGYSIGKFKNNKKNGEFIQYSSGHLEYKGDFKDDKRTGDGILYYNNGQIRYKGGFENGQYHGTGTEYDETGEQIYSGKWKHGDYG